MQMAIDLSVENIDTGGAPSRLPQVGREGR